MMKRYSIYSLLFVAVVIFQLVHVGNVRADAGTFTSDDFNSFNLNTSLWTYTDPLGDDTLYMTGANTTSDAQLHISNPAGSKHDFWENSMTAPRIMQSANDDSIFQIEVKFQSEMYNRIAIEGVLVEQDEDDVLRFDFYVKQSNIVVSAYNFVSGNATTEIDSPITSRQTGPIDLYMRVKRDTSTWTMSYSLDGSTWNPAGSFSRTLTVSKVGLFFANAGDPAPLNKGVVDYFFNTDSPITSEDGATVTDVTGPMIYNVSIVPGNNYFDIYWMTDEPAKGSVDYGLTTSYELGTVDSSSAGFLIGHHVRISGLNENTSYHFRIKSEDNIPNSSSAGDYQDTSLPVELIAFTADASDGEVLLSWQTASEVNNIGFEVYRSDGKDSLYQMIASYRTDPDLLGAGNSTRLHNYNYRDQGLNNGTSYWYKIADVDLSGTRTFHGPVTATPDRSRSLIAQQYQLLPNYPNPFNPTTTLKFKVDRLDNSESVVKLTIYNSNGQIVRELFKGSVSDGNYVVRWDGRDRNGKVMPSGYYFARLESGRFSQTRKMLLLK